MEENIGEHRAIYEDTTLADHVNRMCLADLGCSCPASISPTPTAPAWRHLPKSGFLLWIPEVVRAAFSLPGHAKVRHRQGKMVLKEAAEGFLPKEIVYRPKASLVRRYGRGSPRARSLVDDVLLSGELSRPASCNGRGERSR